jgi:arginine utilization protein RocB
LECQTAKDLFLSFTVFQSASVFKLERFKKELENEEKELHKRRAKWKEEYFSVDGLKEIELTQKVEVLHEKEWRLHQRKNVKFQMENKNIFRNEALTSLETRFSFFVSINDPHHQLIVSASPNPLRV